MTETPLLQVDDLHVTYGGRLLAVDGAHLRVDRGEVVGVIGPNGAGKTSLLRGIAGFPPREGGRVTGGRVRLDGHDVTGRSPVTMAKAGVAMVPERGKVFVSLRVEEHLRLAARLSDGRPADSVNRALDVFPALRKHVRRSAGFLSGGERQLLAIATALCTSPKILLVDEASQGLAPGVVASLGDDFRRVSELDVTVLLVEQNAAIASSLCSRLYVMDAGQMTATGTVKDLTDEGVLARAYLAS